ncbi:MAG: class I SAM-dependent methyltransferase [Candidatus Omnitrophica bacterium]|nr:class I SAM-dependent methyltransferase [Candidatus Omnitrophota bacterium]
MSDNDTSAIYSKEYFLGSEYNNYLADKEILQKNFGLRLRMLQAFMEPNRHRHLLEIGCAYGFFLELVRKQFDTVLGLDISGDGVLYAREQLKVDAVKADFLKYDLKGRRFDVVCMWDTIEHLSSPDLYLEKISNNTKSGSLVALTTGDIDSFNARLRRGGWRMIHPPTHIHFFSSKTLTRMLDRFGFDVVYNSYCGFYRGIDYMAYRMFVLNKGNSLIYNLLRKYGLTRVRFYLNLFDVMYVIARRR